MDKGYIFFQHEKIPFVAENYQIELFSDNIIVNDFCKHYNVKQNYVLHGQRFSLGTQAQNTIFLVNYSEGTTCYLYSYIIFVDMASAKFRQLVQVSPACHFAYNS